MLTEHDNSVVGFFFLFIIIVVDVEVRCGNAFCKKKNCTSKNVFKSRKFGRKRILNRIKNQSMI